MTNDTQAYFIILMTSLEQGLSSVEVEWLENIYTQIKQQLPIKPEDLPFLLDRHKNDFAILHKNAEFLARVIDLAKVAHELQKLKQPSIALKRSIHSKASQQ